MEKVLQAINMHTVCEIHAALKLLQYNWLVLYVRCFMALEYLPSITDQMMEKMINAIWNIATAYEG